MHKPSKSNKNELTREQREQLLKALKARFEKNMNRHQGLEWAKVQATLEANTEKLWSLSQMEQTGGEPDVVDQNKKTGEYIFYDCSAESPKARRSFCYDREALQSRKENKPKDNVMDAAAAMGIELLTEEQYRKLQTLGEFDTKTSSWLHTPSRIRDLGGAHLRRSPLRRHFCVSQRRRILLRRPRLPRLVERLANVTRNGSPKAATKRHARGGSHPTLADFSVPVYRPSNREWLYDSA